MFGSFKCRPCKLYFPTRNEYLKHCRRHKVKTYYSCLFCPTLQFRKKKDREIHSLSHRCDRCGEEYFDISSHKLDCYNIVQYGAGAEPFFPAPFVLEKTAFKGFLKGFRHRTLEDYSSPEAYYVAFGEKIQAIIKNNFTKRKPLKVQLVMVVEFIREILDVNNEVSHEKISHYVNSDLSIVLNSAGVKSVFKRLKAQIQSQIELFEKNGSGWNVNRIEGADIKLAVFDLFKGGCKIKLPLRLKNKKAVINSSSDKNCFVHAFLIAGHLNDVDKQNRARVHLYQKYKKLYNWNGITFPTTLSGVKKFEKNNRNIAINVFSYDDNNLGSEEDPVNIVYRSPGCSIPSHRVINLLYLVNSSSKTGHWLAVSSLSRYLQV